MKKLLTIGAVALLAVAPIQANNVTDRRGYIEDIAIAFRRNGLVYLSVTHRHPDINGNRYKAIFAWDCRKKAFYYARSFTSGLKEIIAGSQYTTMKPPHQRSE